MSILLRMKIPKGKKKVKGKKAKDKGEAAEYVGHLVELHRVQGAVLRLLEKSLND